MSGTSTIICRICLNEIIENKMCCSLSNDSDNDAMLHSKLLSFIPELDLKITQNPIACDKCTLMINNMYQFKQLCIRNEIILKNQSLVHPSLKYSSPVVENPISADEIKEEFFQETIKVEPVVERLSFDNAEFYCCYQCYYATSDKIELTDHVRTHRFRCNQCSYTTPDNLCLTSHKGMHSNNLRCRICNYTCREMESLVTHTCTRTTSDSDNEIKSKSIECSNPSTIGEIHEYKCKLCDYATPRKRQLTHHIQTHTGERPLKCNLCDYTCSTMFSLKTHNYKHTGEWPYKCDKCDYKSHVKARLKHHKMKHDDDKPIKCNLCDYRTHDSRNLKKHTYHHSGEWPFKCDECDFATSVKRQLVEHKRKHTGEKPYKCGLCEYRSNHLHGLKLHVYKHTGEFPFKCDKCDYKTYLKPNLDKHKLRRHAEENKLFKCNLCSYANKLMSGLKLHMYKHTDDWPYKCENCDYKTHSKFNFNKHKVRTRNCLNKAKC